MQIKHSSSYRDYWSSNIERRDPFMFDVLYKIRFLYYLNKKFKVNYTLTAEQSVNENLVQYKGRIDFKEYMAKKRIECLL